MAFSMDQIRKILSHFHQRGNENTVHFSEYFTNGSSFYSILSQQDYQMFQMRDLY